MRRENRPGFTLNRDNPACPGCGIRYRSFMAGELGSGRDSIGIKPAAWRDHCRHCEGDDALPAWLMAPRDQARRIILEELEQGESPAAFIRLLTEEAGIGWRTVMNVKKALGVVSYRVSAGNKGAGGWYWALPERMASRAA